MNLQFLFAAIFIFSWSALFAHSIIFIHLGPALPKHLFHSIYQASLFNSEKDIYLIGHAAALANAPPDLKAQTVACETLAPSPNHVYFATNSRLDKVTCNGFWFFTTERFFYLEEFMKKHKLRDVVHLENDVLLYADISKLIPAFQKAYPDQIGATFENDERCVPGFLYIPSVDSLSQLVQYIAERSHLGDTDMTAIGQFRKMKGSPIATLPIVPSAYVDDFNPLSSVTGVVSEESEIYCSHFEEFESIFDAASLGIFLGGDDPTYHTSGPGKVNPNCVFVPTHCSIEWETDSEDRKIPFLVYKEIRYKINNLHLTNKGLLPTFVSK